MSEAGNAEKQETPKVSEELKYAAKLKGAFWDWQRGLAKQVERGQITQDQKEERIARSMAVLTLLLRRYREEARRDPLTNLANRREFERRFDNLVKQESTFGLLMVDIDHFKKVNDEYGHLAGDNVLIQVGLILGNNLREIRQEGEVDVIARFGKEAARVGGEEFAVLLPGIKNEENLRMVAERIRLAFSDNHLQVTTGRATIEIPITISIGGGVYRGRDAETFRGGVDKSLYAAKDAGRNRAEILPSPQ